MHIDPDRFLGSFELKAGEDTTDTVGPWAFGERIAFLSQNERERYASAWQEIDHYKTKSASFIPTRSYKVFSNTFETLEEKRKEGRYKQDVVNAAKVAHVSSQQKIRSRRLRGF